MKMSGSRALPAAQTAVWKKLNDVAVLRRCIPGCESLERLSDDSLKAVVAVKIGPVSARFNGDVALTDLDPPNAYRLSGTGNGGAAGFASGGANVRLAPQNGGTLLSYDVDAKIGGKLAQVGNRLIDATAARLANEFFDRFAAEVEGRPPVAAEKAPARVPVWVWWLVAFIAAAAIVIYWNG